jgi:hypothetical protein
MRRLLVTLVAVLSIAARLILMSNEEESALLDYLESLG